MCADPDNVFSACRSHPYRLSACACRLFDVSDMTYSLNTLQSSWHLPSTGASARIALRARDYADRRFCRAAVLVAAMLSFTPSDAAWSTSGTGGDIKNWWAYRAWIADGCYFRRATRSGGAWLPGCAYGCLRWPAGCAKWRGRWNRGATSARALEPYGLLFGRVAVAGCRQRRWRWSRLTGSNSGCRGMVAAFWAISSVRSA